MKKLKRILFSENGMRAVNALFFLSLLFYKSGFICIAYTAWIVYLRFCLGKSESKGSRIVYTVLTVIAAVMIVVNLFFTFTQMKYGAATVGIIGGADGPTAIFVSP